MSCSEGSFSGPHIGTLRVIHSLINILIFIINIIKTAVNIWNNKTLQRIYIYLCNYFKLSKFVREIDKGT
jgi:hypothetical protein